MKFRRIALRASGWATLGLGLAVMAGWWTGHQGIISLRAGYIGMRFNTALCFALAGAAVLALDWGWRRIGLLSGGLVLLLGGLSFLEVSFGWHLGIDELFMRDYLAQGLARPGLMAGNTAVAFVVFGLAIGAEEGSPGLRITVRKVGGGILLALGGLSLLGYAAGIRSFTEWGLYASMALNTAMGVFLLGGALLLQVDPGARGESAWSWLAVPLTTGVLAATFIVAHALDRHDQAQVDRLLDREMEVFAAQLREDYQMRSRSLSRVAARWRVARVPISREEWEADAARLVADHPGYRALERVDQNLRIQWVIPLVGNEAALGADLSGDPLRRAPYLQALQTKAPASGPDLDLLQGGRGFIHCMPLERAGRADGFVAAVFSIPDWLESVRYKRPRGMFEVREGERVIYRSEAPDLAARSRGRDMPFVFEGRIWHFRIYPSAQLLSELGTPMPRVVLSSGLAISALLGLLFQAAQRAEANARRGRDINQRLQAEVRERQRAEAALQEAHALQSLVLENATVGIGLVVDRRFKWVNHRAADMVGIPYDRLLGGPTRLLYPDESTWAYIGEEGYAALGRGEAFEAEFQLRRADGQAFWCRFVGKALDPLHPHEGSIWMFEDIDARVASERMKREFVSTVSHELRTPLTAIRGSLGLLRSGVGGALDAKGADLLGLAISNCDRLVRLVNDILDLEKLRSGGMTFELAPVDLSQLVAEAAGGNLGVATQAGVLLAFQPSSNAVVVRADAHRLRQVLDNLLSNAVKFSPQGGRVDLEIMPRTGGWTVVVADQGRGIPEAFLPHLFEPFTQADASDAREKGGTGLGLSITKALVEGMGGAIRVESRVGTGTRFLIDLPG